MPTTKLTKAAVERIALSPGKQVLYWDTELRGFGMLVGGTKTYIAQRRMPDGKTKRVTVGAVGEFRRVEDARAKAGGLLAGLRDGQDPAAERKKAATRDRTFGEWLEAYLTARHDLRPKSIKEYRGSAERHLSAWIGRPLRTITPDDVEERHAEIGRDAGPATADAAMRCLRAIWNHARDRDPSLPEAPTRRLRKQWFKVAPRTRMVRFEELPAFWRAAGELENRIAADYVRIMLCTGLRRSELAALRWSEVDLVGRVIRLGAERVKAGRRFDLPMNDLVFEMLVALRSLGRSGDWVFPASSRSGHIEEPKFALDAIEQATGITVSPHDLRRTFVTIAEAADISATALRALVNHSLGRDVTSGYIQMTTERLRVPAQHVADKLRELCQIEAPAGENVAALAR